LGHRKVACRSPIRTSLHLKKSPRPFFRRIFPPPASLFYTFRFQLQAFFSRPGPDSETESFSRFGHCENLEGAWQCRSEKRDGFGALARRFSKSEFAQRGWSCRPRGSSAFFKGGRLIASGFWIVHSPACLTVFQTTLCRRLRPWGGGSWARDCRFSVGATLCGRLGAGRWVWIISGTTQGLGK
jgi:hypothetical protein